MAQDSSSAVAPFVREMFSLGVYKRNQGRIARQVTFAALAIAVLIGSWQLGQFVAGEFLDLGGNAQPSMAVLSKRLVVPIVSALLGWWISFRVVNVPVFADFLIAVEAEMNKVSWPTRAELVRGVIVVIVVMFVLAAVLFGYDLVWRWILHQLGVVP
ncbi:MAG: preprotein translocase subunit SecE [Pirellulales bacterium]|nr:preprotein translocase subunit SecE [Planctomycetales bacterium]